MHIFHVEIVLRKKKKRVEAIFKAMPNERRKDKNLQVSFLFWGNHGGFHRRTQSSFHSILSSRPHDPSNGHRQSIRQTGS